MRRSFCYALMAGLLFLSLFVWRGPDEGVRAAPSELLEAAMAAAGARTEIIVLNAWTKLPESDLSDDGLEAVVTAAMAKLGYRSGEYAVSHSRSERHRLAKAELAANRRHVVVMVQVLYPTGAGKGAEAYLVINTEEQSDEADPSGLRGPVGAAAACAGGSPRITTCLVGWLDGKLEKDKWSETLHKAGQALGVYDAATVVEANFAGLTGFSPLLPESIVVGNKRINVNLAVRYSPRDNRTYVVIASPVITGEY